MTDLPLHLVAENATTVTFGWEPPAGAVGYYFYADSKRVSNSTNGQQAQVKFKKVAGGKYTVVAVGAIATGDWPPAAPPVGPPQYDVRVTPNQYDLRDGPQANYQLCWLDHTSDNGPRTLDRLISDEWWMEWTFTISPDWDVSKQGDWGRIFNSHVDWMAPGAEDITSAQAVDYIGGRLMYHSEPGGNKDWTIQSPLVKGVPHTLRWKSILGRVDGGTQRPGSATIWYDGTKVVDTGPINTIYRWKNGGLEEHQWLWTGYYSRNVQKTLPFTMSFCRFGKTEQEMLADKGWKPNPNGFRLSDHLIPGKVDYGPATATLL